MSFDDYPLTSAGPGLHRASGFCVRRLACLITAGLAVLTGCARTASPNARTTISPAVPVELAPVEYTRDALPVRVVGSLERKSQAQLSFKVGGLVEVVPVRAGDTVRAGEELARLQLAEIDAQVVQARAAMEKAHRDLGRVERLESSAVATRENLQDAQTAVEVAEAQWRIAEFNRQHAVIVAPADGQVLRRSVEPNELVAAGRTILEFAADDDGWLLRSAVAENDAVRLAPGDRVDIRVGDRVIAGTLTQLAGAVDSTTRLTPIEVTLSDAPARARSGSVAEARLYPKNGHERPVVPAMALLEGDGGRAALFIVAEGTGVAERVWVEIEALRGARAYLRTPLPRTARVVVRGAEYLTPGAAVIVSAPSLAAGE